MSANTDELFVWVSQFGLGQTDCHDEWLKLAQHTCTNVKNDPVIHDQFAHLFPNLHWNLSINVDTHPADDFMNEADFSLIRSIKDPNQTQTRFDQIFRFRQNYLSPILELARELGNSTQKKGKVKSADTHGKCRLICEKLENLVAEHLTPEKMAGLSVRNMEKDGNTVSALDQKLERSKLGMKKEYNNT